MTNAEEERARPPPSTKAALAPNPICVAMAMKTSEVSRNCPEPRMKASRPTLLSLLG